jgi:hypothetical protein
MAVGKWNRSEVEKNLSNLGLSIQVSSFPDRPRQKSRREP